MHMLSATSEKYPSLKIHGMGVQRLKAGLHHHYKRVSVINTLSSEQPRGCPPLIDKMSCGYPLVIKA